MDSISQTIQPTTKISYLRLTAFITLFLLLVAFYYFLQGAVGSLGFAQRVVMPIFLLILLILGKHLHPGIIFLTLVFGLVAFSMQRMFVSGADVQLVTFPDDKLGAETYQFYKQICSSGSDSCGVAIYPAALTKIEEIQAIAQFSAGEILWRVGLNINLVTKTADTVSLQEVNKNLAKNFSTSLLLFGEPQEILISLQPVEYTALFIRNFVKGTYNGYIAAGEIRAPWSSWEHRGAAFFAAANKKLEEYQSIESIDELREAVAAYERALQFVRHNKDRAKVLNNLAIVEYIIADSNQDIAAKRAAAIRHMKIRKLDKIPGDIRKTLITNSRLLGGGV